METGKSKISRKKKVLMTLLVIILIAVIVILGFIIYKLLHKQPEERGTVEDLIVGEEEPEDSPQFMTDMNMVWSFPSGKRTSNDAVIGNSYMNQYDVYFEVYLDDEEQTLLYSSDIIPVGKRLGKKLKLNQVLPDGEHLAVCTFHLLDNEDNNREISRVSFNVTLIFMSPKDMQS